MEAPFLDGVPIIEVSCETGTGFDALRHHLAIAAGCEQERDGAASFRLAIDRTLAVRGSGVIVTGTVASGCISVGGRLVLGSTAKHVRIRGLHVRNETADKTVAGDRAAVDLAGVAIDEMERGDWLLDPDVRDPQTGFVAALSVVDDFPRAVKHNVPVHVYHATSHTQGRLMLLDSAPVAASGRAQVDVLCHTPLHVKVGDRVVFRDQGLERTLGGGRVVDLNVPRTRRRSEARRRRLRGIDPAAPARSLAHLSTLAPVAAHMFARAWNVKPQTVRGMAQRHGLERVAGHWLAPALTAKTRREIEDALAAHHRVRPDSEGLTLEEAAGHDPARRLMIDALVANGSLRAANGRYAVASHQATLPDDVRRLFSAVEPLLDSTQPPSLGDIAKRLKRPFATFEQQMRALPAFGLAVRISTTRYYLPRRLLELADAAVELARRSPFTVRQFRDATGVGRNVVIEVLEHFDAQGLTRRQGDTRRIVGERSTVTGR